MDENIERYRNSFFGRKCQFCKYNKHVLSWQLGMPDYYDCILKDKTIKYCFIGKFCKYYTLAKDGEK